MIIHNYINKNLFAPVWDWSEYEFRRRCYERWAANEILNRVTETPELNQFFVVLYFRHQMDSLASVREGSDGEFIFTTARDVADEIVSLLKEV